MNVSLSYVLLSKSAVFPIQCYYVMNRLNLKRHVTSYDIRRLRRRQKAKYFFFVLHVIYEMTSSNERVKCRSQKSSLRKGQGWICQQNRPYLKTERKPSIDLYPLSPIFEQTSEPFFVHRQLLACSQKLPRHECLKYFSNTV